jgi:hypothetical protein
LLKADPLPYPRRRFNDCKPHTNSRYTLESSPAQLGNALVATQRRSATTGAEGVSFDGMRMIIGRIFSTVFEPLSAKKMRHAK